VKRSKHITKILAVVFGVIGYGIVFVVKYLPGVLEAALGIFGIVGGPVLGAFTLGMFFPFANTIGAFIGCFSSLIFTMWMGFGSTVAKKAGTYDSSLWNPSMNRTTIHCPLHFFNTTVPEPSTPFEPFTHLELYEVSYIWYSAIAWLWCVVVGVIVSAFKPTNHKKVDKRLITPAFMSMFGFYPKFIRTKIRDYYDEIGTDFAEEISKHRHVEDGNSNINKGFQMK